jgi:hypothetical protein
MKSLSIVGGTYLETCSEPETYTLLGSGLRAACALSGSYFDISFHTCVADEEASSLQQRADTFGFGVHITSIEQTVEFKYYHPLSIPNAFSSVLANPLIQMPELTAEKILYYGMAEANTVVHGEFVVYDPQNGVSFQETKSKATHLALVLNRKEACSLSGMPKEQDLKEIGKHLLIQENAEAIVIKDGANGGLVITHQDTGAFPIYATETISPIGSGDAFSAAFALKWMIEGSPVIEAAHLASQFAAEYCETQILPFPKSPVKRDAVVSSKQNKKVYLAGPFFTSSERWLINELRKALRSFGAEVFSPLHDVGVIDSFQNLETKKYVAGKDIEGLNKADTILAVLNGADTGTVFEIGYAVSHGKRVVVLVENINANDLVMIVGSGCIVTHDIPSAVYKATW